MRRIDGMCTVSPEGDLELPVLNGERRGDRHWPDDGRGLDPIEEPLASAPLYCV